MMKRSTHRPRLTALATVALALLVASCAGAAATNSDATLEPLPTLEPTQTPGRDEGRISFTPVASGREQVEALADGEVTRDEYDAAVARTLQCLDDKGVGYTEPVYDEGSYQYTYTIINHDPIDPNELSPHDECWMEHERDIQTQWVNQQLGVN